MGIGFKFHGTWGIVKITIGSTSIGSTHPISCGEKEKVIELKLQVNRMIPINSVALYIAMDEYEQGVSTDEVEVNTKYKIVDKKVKHVAAPLPEYSWQ